jgi:hypothetical protein
VSWKPVDIEPETRLRALRWHISKAVGQQESARVLRDSTFFITESGDPHDGGSLVPCRMHMSVEEITRAPVCDLVLYTRRSVHAPMPTFSTSKDT